MPWVRLEDGFAEHPKIESVGALGMAMYVAGLCYCNRNLTDGFIPEAAARRFLDLSMFAECSAEQRANFAGTSEEVRHANYAPVHAGDVIHRLVEVGLWITSPGGYHIHDYFDYQPSKADVEQERRSARDRMRRGRTSTSRSENVRPNFARTSPEVRAKFADPDPTRTPIEPPTPTAGAVGASLRTATDHRSPRAKGTNPRARAAQERRRASAESLGRNRAPFYEDASEMRAELNREFQNNAALIDAGMAEWERARSTYVQPDAAQARA